MSELTIGRLDNGQVAASFSNMKGEDVGVIGAFEGNATLVFGTVAGANATEYDVYSATGAKIDMKDASQNTAFFGVGFDVDVLDTKNEANIEWNAAYSRLSTQNTNRAISLQVSQYANNNEFNFGWGDAVISDSGDYNVFNLGSGTSYYANTMLSNGAVVLGGSGKGTYDIAGNNGVFVQGSGAANYQINSPTENTLSGFKNAIISDYVATVTDNGYNSLILLSNAASRLTENGVHSIARVSDDNQVTLGAQGQYAGVFAGGKTSKAVIIAETGKVYTEGEYDLAQVKKDLAKDGISYSTSDSIRLDDLLYKRGWANNKNGYTDYQMGAESGHSSNITAAYIKAFAPTLLAHLKIGDEGAKYSA